MSANYMENMHKIIIAIVVFLGLSVAADARTKYALIVGVTKYPHLAENTWLVGPDNDARLLQQFLTGQAGFDAANVTVLADGVEGAATPTLANIRGAMKSLAERIRASGEEAFVYLHFSGHGSQMPARMQAGENDGKDEVFLPADTKNWDDALKGFPNAYVDDDIGADLTALREAGAFVWAVFDACHSASATRAAPGESLEVSRRLDPRDLGVPEELLASATRSLGEETERGTPVSFSAGTDKGGLVAFFAAQTVETTPEMPLPRDGDQQERYGLFTYTLIESMAKHPGISYRQLGQTILQAYSAMNRRAPTPLFEGDLDARVFSADGEPPVVQWQVKADGDRATIEAGLIHGLTQGTKLALLANAADTLEDAKGYLEVNSPRNLSSSLKPIAHGGLDKPTAAMLKEGGWVRPVEFAVDFELTVARLRESEPSRHVNELLEMLASDKRQLFRIRLVDEGMPADLSLAVASEREIADRMAEAGIAAGPAMNEIRASAGTEPRLWFLSGSGEVSLLPGMRSPSLGLDGVLDRASRARSAAFEAELAGALTKIFRATNLARMTEASDFRDRVDVTFLIRREESGKFEPIAAGTAPPVSDYDEIHVRVTNKSSRAVDLNVLHIGTDYAITAADPARIERNGTEKIGLFAVNTETLGIERLIAVVTEAMPGSDVEDLRFLAQGGLRKAETDKNLGETGGLVSMLHAMGKEAATRGTTPLGQAKGAKGAVTIYQVETVARK